MQNPPYMFLVAAVPTSPLGLALPFSFPNYIHSPLQLHSSTSVTFAPQTPPTEANYPITYPQFLLSYSCITVPQGAAVVPSVQNIQTDDLANIKLGSSTTAPSHLTHSPLSECSIKIEQSAVPHISSDTCKKPSLPPPKKPKNSSKNDRQYDPNKRERIVPRRRLHQNQNRNVVPNEINQILSFIQKPSKSGHLVARLLQKFPEGQNYSIQRFYLYQSLLRERASHHTNERSLRLITELYEPEGRIWPLQEQRYYNRLCRLLVRHFLLEDSVFIILTSKRMKSEKKIDHLRARRKVAQKVLEMLRGG